MKETVEFEGQQFVVGRRYNYDDLTYLMREDADKSIPNWATGTMFYYVPEIVPHSVALAVYRDTLKKNFDSEYNQPRILKLAQKIEREGLYNPPLGTEGYHRTLAMLHLGWDIPYIRVFDKHDGSQLMDPQFS